jgi:hypothetical protein
MEGIIYKMKNIVMGIFIITTACSAPDEGLIDNQIIDEAATCEVTETKLTTPTLSDEQIGQVALALSSSSTLKWWRYAGDVVELQDALDCGLRRWAESTCMPIDISYYPNHWMRQDTAANMNGFSGIASTTDGWATSRIKLEDAMAAEKRCQVAVHEIGHVLRKSGSHPCATNTMCNSSTSVANSRISQADLDLVCAKYACECQIPE